MRVCRFNTDRLGLVEGDTVLDASGFLATLPSPTWAAPLADPVCSRLSALQAWASGQPNLSATGLAAVTLAAPVPRPSKIIGAPVNYHAHLAEAQADRGLHQGQRVYPIDEIGLFLKATSALCGPDSCISLGHPGRRVDHEVEVAVVIGRVGSRLSVQEAWSVVGGYSLALDLTLRGREDRSMRKSGDGYAVLGPWLTTPDAVPDPAAIPFSLSINGIQRQSATTAQLIRTIPELISWASHFYTLYPGDIIMTGTPAGVGPLHPGDQLVATSPVLGELCVHVTS